MAIAEDMPEINQPREMPSAGLVRHMRYRTIHVRGGLEGDFKTECGLTLLPDDYEEVSVWPAVAWPLCGRKKCFGSA